MPGALDGLRVLDMSRVLAGPFCCMMLGDHGADVVKVEPAAGDETRTYGPPFVDGESAYYMALNRNKRSIVLDLASASGQEAIRRLVCTSDVLVENFRTGTMERWGLGYSSLSQLNPRLVYLAISGFGRSGPYAQYAGYDGALVQFRLTSGTTEQLAGIGVRDGSGLTGAAYPNMPLVGRGWTRSSAFFKAEGVPQQINIGLGRGGALDIFNGNMTGYNVIGP